MRILVTGAGGLLGGRLAQLLSERSSVIAAYRESPPPPGLTAVPLDLAAGDLGAALRPLGVEAVLHAAAVADPDRCEADPGLAWRTNVECAVRVAQWCAEQRLPLVALSTDLVFGGDRAPYRESDPPAPILVYGRTKADAEIGIAMVYPGAAIARVSLVVGQGHGARRTASESIAAALRAGRPVRLFTDQFRTPIDDRSLADGLSRILEGGLGGIFHLGGPERLSRFELGRRVASSLGLSESLLVATTSLESPPKAPRPADVSMDARTTRTLLGWAPRPLDACLPEGRLV